MLVRYIGDKNNDDLQISEIYLVKSLRTLENQVHIAVYYDKEFLLDVFNAKYFEIIDNKLPSNFICEINGNMTEIDLHPKRWAEWRGQNGNSFWEDLDDNDPAAIACYKEEVLNIWEECGKGFVDKPFTEKPKLDPWESDEWWQEQRKITEKKLKE